MRIASFVAALKAAFLLNNGTAAEDLRYVDQRLIEDATLGAAAAEYWRYAPCFYTTLVYIIDLVVLDRTRRNRTTRGDCHPRTSPRPRPRTCLSTLFLECRP